MKITRRLEGTAVKIFVVEDDVEIREMECYALNNSGFQTEAFENGADFFKALARELRAWTQESGRCGPDGKDG